jgi:hypothetical protein
MKDDVILRLLQDAAKQLEHVNFPAETPHVVPVYNALLAAVKANHPQEPYLQALPTVEGGTGPEELRVLLGQLRILLEAWVEGNQAADGMTRPLGTQNFATGR